MKKNNFANRASVRVAKAQQKVASKPLFRFVGARGAATLALGAALSVGGLSDAFTDTHYLIEKKLDSVEIVRHSGEQSAVVARLDDGFAGNAVFKLARVLPDRYVSRELSLFEKAWFPIPSVLPPTPVLAEEMGRINSAIRHEFFSTAIPYGALIHEKSVKYDVDPALVAAVIEQESRFRKGAVSPVGARGLMQLMPRTGHWMGAKDLHDPEQNIDAGVKYIKYLDKQFNGNLKKTIAAYNAGEGNVRRYGGIPPFRETRSYVKKVLSNYDKRTRQLERFERDQIRAEGGGVAGR